MQKTTTIILGDEVQAAAQELALHYGCSASEAIRRSVLGHLQVVLRVSPARRKERVEILDRLICLFEGHDAGEEIRLLKEQDEDS